MFCLGRKVGYHSRFFFPLLFFILLLLFFFYFITFTERTLTLFIILNDYLHLHLHCTAHTSLYLYKQTGQTLTLLTLYLHLYLHCTAHTYTILNNYSMSALWI